MKDPISGADKNSSEQSMNQQLDNITDDVLDTWLMEIAEDAGNNIPIISDEELDNLLREIPLETSAQSAMNTPGQENRVRDLQKKTNQPKHTDVQPEPIQPARLILSAVITIVTAGFSTYVTWMLIITLLLGLGIPVSTSANVADKTIMDRFDMYMINEKANALEGVMAIEKVWWLSDDDLIAPEPDQSRFGSTDDPSSLQWLLDEAKELLGIDDFVFNTDIQIHRGSKVNYYLDEAIFAISWQELKDTCIYTYGEVKIAHGSQFRRFLAGGTYGADKQFITTRMASDVNAVLASSGDFYKFRNLGIIVYDGEVKRVNSRNVDTCFIDDKGDLIFSYRGQLETVEEAQKFVDDNNIRFSIAFGPALIDNGQLCKLPASYPCGEIYDTYARAGLCQMGSLHYVVVTANREKDNYAQRMPTIPQFAARLAETGCQKAYTLDGGQTGVIAMNGQMMNPAQYGSQRAISDIFYFATALPDGE